MIWFMVLLFWNPAIEAYDVADGWYPMPYATKSLCEERSDFVEEYLPASQNDQATVDCILASSVEEAIAIAKR